jgi:hypothetical protein
MTQKTLTLTLPEYREREQGPEIVSDSDDFLR